jgi:hypothetical protein
MTADNPTFVPRRQTSPAEWLSPVNEVSMLLEILYFLFVLFGCIHRFESSQITTLFSFRICFTGVKPVLSGF